MLLRAVLARVGAVAVSSAPVLPPRNLTVRQFAQVTSSKEQTVRDAINRGDVRAHRVGRGVRIPLSEFARLGLDPPTDEDLLALVSR